MKNLTFLFVLLVPILGCDSTSNNKTGNSSDFFYLKYNFDNPPEVSIDKVMVNYISNLKDSIYQLNYIYKIDSIQDTITYILRESEHFKPSYLLNGKKKKFNDFVFVSKKGCLLKGQYFTIYKYASSPLTIDGCFTHFWTPKIGILIVRSSTWRNYRKLKSNNDSINHFIDLLTEFIYQDTEFYKGCTEELELIQKSDAKEFYDWKYKNIIEKASED